MSLSFLAAVFTGNNQSGAGTLIGLGNTPRYNKFPNSIMHSQGIHKNLSSATVYKTSKCDATVILFGSPFLFLQFPDYQGPYMQITNRKNASSELDVNNFSTYGLNNNATSMLLIGANKGFDIRLSYRDLFLNKWKDIIDNELSGTEAKRDGNPTLTWEMWPGNISYLSSSKCYLKIHQKLDIELHCWPDYDASITYHIHLYLDSGGHLYGYTARWAYWVESGVKAGEIGNQLESQVISGMGKLNTELTNQLSSYSSISFKDLYYLPGKQTSSAPTGVRTGWTTDDVTIVLEL